MKLTILNHNILQQVECAGVLTEQRSGLERPTCLTHVTHARAQQLATLGARK